MVFKYRPREGIAPLSAVATTGGRPQLACTKAEFKSAPRVDDDLLLVAAALHADQGEDRLSGKVGPEH